MKINKEFLKRQQYLLQQIGSTGIAIIFAAKERQRNGQSDYPYHQDSDFFYLTGFTEPNAIAVFIPNREQGEYILFSREKVPEKEQWFGTITGQKAACIEYGAHQAFPIDQADSLIPDLIKGREQIYTNIGYDPEFDNCVINWVKQFYGQERSGINTPTDLIHIGKITHEMRIQKDRHEIELLSQAAKITANALLKAMQTCKPGMKENDLAAIIAHEFTRSEAYFPSFESIIGAGANSCILHYARGNAELKAGDLVLVDIGVEYQYYAGDITRTFPVNGQFSEAQRLIYQAVLDTQLAVITAIRPGVSWLELQNIARKFITEHLIKLGLLTGNLNDLLEKEAYKPFYMHHIGHWLGLDSHDAGKYKINGKWRSLQPGMVLTVEPGIYISANMPNVDSKWRNIGVRIEDDILVTKNGYEVLSADVPKTIDEIEKLMQK